MSNTAGNDGGVAERFGEEGFDVGEAEIWRYLEIVFLISIIF